MVEAPLERVMGIEPQVFHLRGFDTALAGSRL